MSGLWLQISKLLGAHVVAVTSGATKSAYLKQLGADVVIDMAAAAPGVPLHKLVKQAAPKGRSSVDAHVYSPHAVLPAMLSTSCGSCSSVFPMAL